jgi:methyl-accepting chemotaxis protein
LTVGDRSYQLVTTPFFDEKGKRLGTLGQWTDITEHLAAEKEVAAIVEAAAAGDFRKRIAEADKSGFMLQMAQGLNAILGTSEQALGEIGRILKALAEGDLSQEIRADFKGVFQELKRNHCQASRHHRPNPRIIGAHQHGGARHRHRQQRSVAAHRGAGLSSPPP